MTQDSDTRGSDKPEHGGEGRSPQAEGDRNDEESCVELRGGSTPAAELEVVALELADTKHANNKEAYDEEQQQVGEKAVDAEHGKDGGVVAREVSQVEIDSALDFAEVGRLGDALNIEELGDGPQVGEPRGYGCVAQTVETAREVHPRRQGVDGNAEARHDVGQVWSCLRRLQRLRSVVGR